jgi:isopenicillin N synthase-like dioxygenase
MVGFKETVQGFFDFCTQLVLEVMRAIAVGLGIDETYFEGYMARGDHKLRLLHYPEVDRQLFKSNVTQVRAGAHTDYGAITLLFQDGRGGLQVKTPSGEYVDATPIDNTVVVNAGDLLARWSNDLIKSTVHRVIEPPFTEGGSSDSMHPSRYSIA